MNRHLLLILLLQCVFGFDLKAQVDSVTFYFEADNSSSKYEIVNVPREKIPNKLIVLNCSNDTLGVWTNNQTDQTLTRLSIQVEKYELSQFTYDTRSSCEFRYGKKHGQQIDYFDFETVKDVCISANPLVKTKGSWRKGQKHGKWIYYNPDGTLDRIEVYKKNNKKSG